MCSVSILLSVGISMSVCIRELQKTFSQEALTPTVESIATEREQSFAISPSIGKLELFLKKCI